MAKTDIVQKLWSLCDVLRDDGITYQDYVTELTFILFPKMLEEKGLDTKWLPQGYRWKDLSSLEGVKQYNFYRQMLLDLGKSSSESKLKKHPRVIEIYANASTKIKEPKHLAQIISEINKLDWYSQEKDDLGDLYEGLLEKNASEKKSGAGQYFTPRPLIEVIVDLLQPQAGELIQDPAAGTCGFLIYADRYIKKATKDLEKLKESEAEFQIKDAFYGVELVPETHRLALMNLMLHDMESDLVQGNSLGDAGANLKPADLIITNPPFGTAKGGGGSTRTDLTHETSNKQLSFLQHIYRSLKPGGRAGVVLPDNVLFESGVGAKIRQDLMEKCNLHTILRLPTGIFYAQSVKTNVLFFQKGIKDKGNTKETWVYDFRANIPSFGKTSPLKREHFAEFEKAYGKDPNGISKRRDQGEAGRFKCFSLDEIKNRDYNLDISWLRDDSLTNADELPDPEDISYEVTASIKKILDVLTPVFEQVKSSGEISSKWEEVKIGDLVEKKVTQGAPKGNGYFYYIDISSIDNEKKAIVNPKKLPVSKAPSRAKQHVKTGDILVSMTRPNLNAVAIVPPELEGAIASTGFDVLRPIKIDKNILFRRLTSASFVNEMSAKVQGALYPAVRPSDIREHMFSIPSDMDQNSFSKKIDLIISKIDLASDELKNSAERLSLYKQSILKKAFEGEL